MIKASEYSERREKLINMMEPQSAMVLFSGVEKCKSADEDYPFEVARNFYYLTGIDQPDSMLLLINVDGERKEFLFVSPFDERKEKWYGRRLTLEEAEARSGVHNVLVNFSFQGKLDATLSPSISQFGDIASLYVDLDRELKIADDTYIDDFLSTIKNAYQNVNILNAYPLVTQLRLRKSVGEIQELRSAIKSTHLGINAALKILAPGRKEYELADAFRHAINDSNGYQGESFNTIMASGIHTTCLHYPKPVDTVPEGGLVLMDLGARNGYYCADVSRTYPASGKFTPEQRAAYDLVLEANKMTADLAKPGVTIEELQNAVIALYERELPRRGLLAEGEKVEDVYFHSVSHFIGLDTHDPYLSPSDRSYRKIPLEAGMVISDEPGLYFSRLGFGIRIEDDLLITEHGSDVLTRDIPKEADQIEHLLQSQKK